MSNGFGASSGYVQSGSSTNVPEITSVIEMLRALPLTSEVYKNMKPSEKTEADKTFKVICKGFLHSTTYKSGDTSKQLYKTCCEMLSYCSFTQQPMFYILLVSIGFVFINLISIGLICLICRKKSKGDRGLGGKEEENQEIIDEKNENDEKENEDIET